MHRHNVAVLSLCLASAIAVFGSGSAQQHLPKVTDRRILEKGVAAVSDSSSESEDFGDRALFSKFVFFTPGIFMGLFVSLILISIFFYGLSYLAAIQTTTRIESPHAKVSAEQKKNI